MILIQISSKEKRCKISCKPLATSTAYRMKKMTSLFKGHPKPVSRLLFCSIWRGVMRLTWRMKSLVWRMRSLPNTLHQWCLLCQFTRPGSIMRTLKIHSRLRFRMLQSIKWSLMSISVQSYFSNTTSLPIILSVFRFSNKRTCPISWTSWRPMSIK